MSVKADERLVLSDSGEVTAKAGSSTTLASLIDNINFTNLSTFYTNKEDSLFKKRIDKLNLKFYLETEKYLNNEDTYNLNKCPDKLFLILFKQISLYIKEVERLNLLIQEINDIEKSTKEKIEELNRKERERGTLHSQHMIRNLKQMNKQLEKRLSEKVISEEKIKAENESLKRQVTFYKEKIQLDLMMKKFQEINISQQKESAVKKLSSTVLHNSNDDISVPVNRLGSNRPGISPVSETEVIASIQKKISKRRNFSDTITCGKQQEILNSSMMMIKWRGDKKDSEINLNVNVKNINKQFAFETKRDTKSTNHMINIGEALISPSKNKPSLSEIRVKKKDTHQNSNLFINTSFNVSHSNITSLHETLSSSIRFYDEEISELHDLELLLSNAKMEFYLHARDSAEKFNHVSNISIEDANDSFTIINKNYPLSDGEDNSPISGNKTHPQHPLNAKKILASAPKKNFPLLASITIDLSSGNLTTTNCSETAATAVAMISNNKNTISSSSSKTVPLIKTPGNRRPNDWNKSDNTLSSKKKVIINK